MSERTSTTRPMVLTIAGFDPSAGAGLLADIKVFESYQVYGQAVCTALTVQNESQFVSPGWVSWPVIQSQLEMLILERRFDFIKIGLVENADTLGSILAWIRTHFPEAFVLWDPIMKASAGFAFHGSAEQSRLATLLRKVNLVTPNIPEAEYLSGLSGAAALDALERYTDVLLKGGHGSDALTSTDLLALDGSRFELAGARVATTERHGSGCTLSAAILANLALGRDVVTACEISKQHMNRFFRNGSRKLGYV